MPSLVPSTGPLSSSEDAFFELFSGGGSDPAPPPQGPSKAPPPNPYARSGPKAPSMRAPSTSSVSTVATSSQQSSLSSNSNTSSSFADFFGGNSSSSSSIPLKTSSYGAPAPSTPFSLRRVPSHTPLPSCLLHDDASPTIALITFGKGILRSACHTQTNSLTPLSQSPAPKRQSPTKLTNR